MSNKPSLILASSSKNRLGLLQTIGISPDKIISPDINEDRLKKENLDHFVMRLAEEKAKAVASNYTENAYIIAADTIVGTKAKLFDKAKDDQEVIKYLNFYSGKRIYIKTAVSVLKLENGVITKKASRLSVNKIKFKRFDKEELNLYVKSGCGIGNAGGLQIEGYGQVLIKNIEGSYSGIIGLPLYETVKLLKGLGYDYFKS